MVFRVNFIDVIDKDILAQWNIDLDSLNSNVVNEYGVVVGKIDDLKETFNDMRYNEDYSFDIVFFLVSDCRNIEIKLSKDMAQEILDNLGWWDISL